MKRKRQGTKPANDPAEHHNRLTEVRRHMASHFKIWQVCSNNACRRARRCSGDADACWRRWWQNAPEETRIILREGIRAQAEGATRIESIRIARQKLAEWREQEAKFAAQAAEPAAASAAQPVTPPLATPRVRLL